MAFHYEVIVDPSMGELFRRKFLTSVSKNRSVQMFKLMAPGISSLWEFKTGKDIFTLSFSEEPGEQKERLVVDSLTLDLKEVIFDTVKSGLAECFISFLAPVSRAPRPELEKAVNECFAALERTVMQGEINIAGGS